MTTRGSAEIAQGGHGGDRAHRDIRRTARPSSKEFNERVAGRVVERERELAKFVDTPPGFGFRGGGSAWMDHLLPARANTGTFRKSLTLEAAARASSRKLLASKKNFWRERLAKWQRDGRDAVRVAARGRARAGAARGGRARGASRQAEADRLAKQYGVADAQEALRRYRADYDAEIARIEAAAKGSPTTFVEVAADDARRRAAVQAPRSRTACRWSPRRSTT